MVNQLDFSFDWDLSRSHTKNTVKKPQAQSKTRNHHPEHHKNNEDRCAVCLNVGEDTMLLPCTHQFHGKCILRWVDQNFSCPLCRREIGQFVPLKTTDEKIHQQFVDIWERHHYKSSEGKKKESPRTEKDDFDVSKQREVSLSQVAAVEEGSVEPISAVIGGCRRFESEEIKIPDEDILIPKSTVRELAEEIVETSQVLIRLDLDESQLGTNFVLSLSSPSDQHSLVFCPNRQRKPEDGAVKFLKHAGKQIARKIISIGSSLLARLEYEDQEEHEETPIMSFSIPRPTLYKLNESLEAGFIAGFLTASLLSVVTRPPNLYPLMREVVPNVAIFFTVYEDLKYRNMDPTTDTVWDCFIKKTLCAGVAATLGHLPQNRFKCTVPIRFGLQFGFFEFFKDRFCEIQDQPCKDHSKLSPLAIAASACSGGVIAATCAFPVELYMKYMELGKGTYLSTYQTFMRKFLPGCVFTALSFEFGRRWIHNQDENDDCK